MRTMWGDHDRFIDTYFTMYNDLYFTGDGCRIDEDGDYWLMGRIDDVVNVSGHRIGTAEVESALVSHAKVAEAAVAPDAARDQGPGLYAFVTLVDGVEASDELQEGTGQARAQGDRPDRRAGQDPVRPGAAQDPLRQDHAPHPAQDRRERGRRRSATPPRWPIRSVVDVAGRRPAVSRPTRATTERAWPPAMPVLFFGALRGMAAGYSHSIVAGGLELMSKTTRLTPRTSLMMRLEMRASMS